MVEYGVGAHGRSQQYRNLVGSLLAECARLALVDPPAGEADAVSGRLLGAAELVPVGNPDLRAALLRNEIEAPEQHAIKGMRTRDQALPVGSSDDKLDQL